ncbi:MAG: flagellar hook-basal body complex protein, partial [Candidatus Poribacteria bacterium]|nr:flagellar hook-basal body complex protein [Candidatus Poribacteria bacterium]
MIGALYAGLSGLKNHQTKINVIGHNLSNINTIGFKKSRVVFREAFSQTLKAAVAAQGDRGGVNPQSVGTGSQIGSIDVLQRNGSAQTTDMPTDLMFRGKGHFVLEVPAGGTKAQEESSRSIKASSIRAFTRNGNFGIDQSGDLVYRPNGYKVLGWQADPVTGVVNTANPDAISSVSFPFMRSISRKTSFVQFASNLDARAGAVEVVSDGGTGLMSSVTPAQDGGDLRPGSHKVRVERAEGADAFTASLDGGESLSIVDSTVTFSDADGRQLVTLKFGDEIKAGTASLEYISKFHKTEIGIFDGLGQRHDAEITFTKESVQNDGTVNPAGTWRWNIEDTHITDAKIVTNDDDKVRTGLIQFNNQTASFSTADPAIAYINVQPVDAEGNETGAGELAVKLD